MKGRHGFAPGPMTKEEIYYDGGKAWELKIERADARGRKIRTGWVRRKDLDAKKAV